MNPDPSTARVAEFLSMSLPTVKRAIAALVAAGWLHRTEGRGRGSRLSYTLVSPGKVVAFQPTPRESGDAEKGANLPSKTGSELSLYQSETGSDLSFHRIKSEPSRIEQSSEQSSRPVSAFRYYRFDGNAHDGPVLVPKDAWDRLNPWASWLRDNGFPKLCDLPIAITGEKATKTYFALPFSKPPRDGQKQDDALRYFAAMLDSMAHPEGLRHAAK